MILHRSIVGLGLLSCLGAGCALEAERVSLPAAPTAFDHALPAGAANWPTREWYRGFGSAELEALVTAASANNLDMAAARARVAQADARARRAHAGILPSVDAGGDANYLAGHSVNGTAHETDWSALLSASYEIDFWGKNRAGADSARHLAVASLADRDTVMITTLAAVADGYFQILSLRGRIAIARSNLDTARNLMQIVDARYKAGLSNPVEVSTERTTLASVELTIPELERQEEEATGSLAVLVGRTPEGFRIKGQPLDALREPAVAPGLPAELLRRRPDVLTAEANLESANADLVVARAALFPSLNLTAAGGVQSPALNAAVISLAGVGPTLNLGASIVQPIFDGGRLRAVRAEVQAQREELLTKYKAAVVAALLDVEKALSTLHHLDDARDFENENLKQSERAFEGAQLRYEEGYGDFLTALEAQKVVYAARDQYSQYKLGRLQALVSLCKALGGGWETPGAPTARAASTLDPATFTAPAASQ